MFVKQSLNNNIVISEDSNGKEIIVIGKGIGFNKSEGDLLDSDKVQKIFYSLGKSKEKRLLNSLKDIPIEYLIMTDKIIKYSERVLRKRLDTSFLVVLADHIYGAVRRAKKNQQIQNTWGDEIKFLYPDEYHIAKKTKSFIERNEDVNLSKDELTFLTIHFVNAQSETNNIDEILEIGQLISKGDRVIEKELPDKIDEDSINFNRFLTHLRYFVIRQRNSIEINSKPELSDLYYLAKKSILKHMTFQKKVARLLEQEQNIELNDDEDLYLVLHIQRLITSVGE